MAFRVSHAPTGSHAAPTRSDRAPDDALAYDPHDPAFHQDPYPLYARLREEAAIHRSRTDTSAWVLSRYADCLALLRDPRVGSLQGFDTRTGPAGGGVRTLARRAREQARARRLVARAVTPWTLQRQRPRLERLVDCQVEAFGGRDAVELMQLAQAVAVTSVCELLDVPTGERAPFREWLPAFAHGLESGASDEAQRLSRAARNFLADHLAERVAADERSPAGGLLTRLAGAEEQGVRLDRRARVTSGVDLALAGYLTSYGLLGNALLALLSHPEAFHARRADPASIPFAVDECLRWDPPLQVVVRFALEDFALRGHAVRAGDPLWLLVGSANRDPRCFLEPERFDPLRAGPPHLGGGLGGAFGIGAELARQGAEVALRRLVRARPRLVLASDHLDRRAMGLFRFPGRLPVAVAS